MDAPDLSRMPPRPPLPDETGDGDRRNVDPFAAASLILGVLWLYWAGSILALLFARIARTRRPDPSETSRQMAQAGAVLGWIGIAMLAVTVATLAFTRSS